MRNDPDMLSMAEHQLTGYIHCQKGYSLKDLIDGMGLSKIEWQRLRPKLDGCFIQQDLIEIEKNILS